MRTSIFAFGCFALAACGGTDGGHVTQPGQSVYTRAVTKLVVSDEGGGFTAQPPTGAACDPQRAGYTLTVADHRLAWSYCAVTGDGSAAADYAPTSGARALSDAEWAALQPTLRGLVVDDGKTCGADKPTLTLVVTTAAGDLTYGDGFYGCAIKDKPLIESDALSAALQALGTLART